MATAFTDLPAAPLPDLPRAPDSDLSRLACAVLERRDFGALTRLPDMLRDMGRDADAERLRGFVAMSIESWKRPANAAHQLWTDIRGNLLVLLFWDIFSWEQCIAVLAKRFEAPSGKGGTVVTAAGRVIDITQWHPVPTGYVNIPGIGHAAHAAGLVEGTLTITGTFDPDVTTATMTDEQLHAAESHPDYEYAVSYAMNPDGTMAPPPGDGWAINAYSDRFLYADRVHWMRPRT